MTNIDKLFYLFDLNKNELNLDKLEKNYTNILSKIKKSNINNDKKKKALHYLIDKYEELERYIKNTIYGKSFTKDNSKINEEVSLNQDRYKILDKPNIIHNNEHYIIDKNSMNTQDIFLNNYPKDVVNPIRRQHLKQILSIDSIFRENYDTTPSTNFIFKLVEPMKNVISMKINSVELPNIWYSFSEEKKSNRFRIDMRNISDGTGSFYDQSYMIIIPEGNYTIDEFQLIINNYFQNAYGTESGLDMLAVRVDNYTGKTIIRANDVNDDDRGTSPVPFEPSSLFYSPDLEYDIVFDLEEFNSRPLQKNVGWVLGFRKGFYTINSSNNYIDNISKSSQIEYKLYLVSEGVFGSNINLYLFLYLDDYNNNFKNSVISGYDRYLQSSNIVGRISLTSGSNTIIVDNNSRIFKQRDYFGPVTIDKINIKLLNKYGEVINLNNNDYSLSLELTQLYS